MSLIKKNILFISSMAVLFGLLYWTGTFADSPGGPTGLGEAPDLSHDDETIVFTYHQDGHGSLYTVSSSGGDAERLTEPEEEKDDTRPVFASDGKIAFLRQWEGDVHHHQQLMLWEEGKTTPLLDEETYVSDMSFSPDGTQLYLLKNEEYKDVYDDGRTQPTEFDVYKLGIESGEMEEVTDLNSVSINSLQVISEEELLYKLDYEKHAIERLQLPSGETTTMWPKSLSYSKAQEPVVSGPRLSPDGNTVAFSDVASTNEKGTFEYEIFTMTPNGENIKQITKSSVQAGHPLFFRSSDQILYTIDRNFAGREPQREYWTVDTDGTDRRQLNITIPSSKQ
ncbi:PD40 domain-containing protein [Halobacillus kuroshimensis]|uniref:PD40 domain-containing protein n=1 Tax=Halobacillus kuroshimensis TaxID=302481 RepID=UPI000421D8BC|nr:PD40 domain-containing protein [Halobacillus kuroshimensis]